MAKDFAVFDSDSHVVEPPMLWEKYLDPEYRTLGKHALWRQEGRTAYLKVNGEIFRDRGNPNLPRHALWRPGMTWDAIGELELARGPAQQHAHDTVLAGDVAHLAAVWAAKRDPAFVDVVRRHLRYPQHLVG